MINILGTLMLFPLYIAVRWPYFKLPIGPDTGYYVSNNTIVNRRFSFGKGWNAHYALCSKFIPEAFLSLIYVWFGHKRYKFFWRFLFSLYNYATAIAVGGIAHVITEGAPYAYLAGLLAFCLVSSEPDYGIYYESSEQFEILFQAWGTLFILMGLQPVQPELLVIGAGFWFIDIFFVKITAIAAAAPIIIGSVIYEPSVLKYDIILFLLFLALYIVLFSVSNENPLATLKAELAHQSFYSRGGSKEVTVSKGYLEQLGLKGKQAARIMAKNPVVSLLAFLGTFWLTKNADQMLVLFLTLYTLGVLSKLAISFLPIWWYMVPVLPLLGIFGALGIFEAMEAGFYGTIVLSVFALSWLALNVYRVFRKDYKDLVAYTWKMHPDMGILHWDLEKILPELEETIKKDSLFVYGYPSLCPMVGQSYDVNFLTGIKYMDEMNPNWQAELHEKMLRDPPAFIFEMLGGFDPKDIKENLGIEYELIQSWKGDFFKYSPYPFNLFKYTNRIKADSIEVRFRSLHVNPSGFS